MIGTTFRATGHVLGAMPFLIVPMILYVIAGQLGSHEALLYGGTLPSGAHVSVTAGAGLVLIGIGCLMLEALKSTHTGTRGMVDQTLSIFLLGAALVAFVVLPAFGTLTFAMLLALQLADVLMAAIIGIKVARRDIGLNA